MSWNNTPLNSNAEYCNGNACRLKYPGIKVWANTEEVEVCVTTRRNNKSRGIHKKERTLSLYFLFSFKDSS